MTTHPLQPHHLSTKSAALGLAGAGVAVAATLGVSSWLANDAPAQAPGQDLSRVVITEGARDSWEGRIGPGTDGVRDSWMPPGGTDRERGGLTRRR